MVSIHSIKTSLVHLGSPRKKWNEPFDDVRQRAVGEWHNVRIAEAGAQTVVHRNLHTVVVVVHSSEEVVVRSVAALGQDNMT